MSNSPAPSPSNRTVEVWIAAPPAVRTDHVAFDLLIDAASGWLRPFGHDGTIEAGLCRYRPSPRGRALLTDAWVTGATNLVMFPATTPAFASLLSNTPEGEDAFVQFSLIVPVAEGAEGVTMLQRLVWAIQQWVVAIEAAAAFVFDDPFIKRNPFFLDERAPAIHDFQITSQEPSLDHWWAVRRYTRGPGWITYLGPDLCDRLGGRERVVREAPVWRADAIGAGAWLTLAPTIPYPPDAVAPLVAFLALLYDWDAYRIEYAEWRAMQTTTLASLPASRARATPVRGDGSDAIHPMPPVRALPEADHVGAWEGGENCRQFLVTAVNLHTAQPMTREERQALDEVIRAYYPVSDEPPGPDEMFVTGATTPEISSEAARFVYGREASMGDPFLDRLRAKLWELATPHVTEIVLGGETVG